MLVWSCSWENIYGLFYSLCPGHIILLNKTGWGMRHSGKEKKCRLKVMLSDIYQEFSSYLLVIISYRHLLCH
jgi:hypothetical protein